MTEDYKETLLNYVTGNLENTSPTTDEIFKEIIEANRNDWIGYMPNGFNAMRIEGFIKPNENTSNLGILYGGYKEYQTGTPYGLIILVDNNLKPIKYINSFSSGTRLRYIQCMIQGDDNLFYAIDDTEYSYKNTNIYNTQKRFLMLNNFTQKISNDYKLNLRTSYILNGTNYQNFYCKNIFKEPESSHFVFTGWYANNSTSAAIRIKAIELKINVGESNVWNYWQVNNNITSQASIVKFNSNSEIKIQILGIPSISSDCYLYTKNYNSNTLNQSTFYTFSYKVATNFDLEQQGLFLDDDNLYFIIDTQDISGVDPQTQQSIAFERHLALYHYTISTSKLEIIYDNYMGTTTTTMNNERMQIEKHNGKLYIALYKIVSTNIVDYYAQRYEGLWKPILVGANKSYVKGERGLYVGSNFNLLQISLYPTALRHNWYFPIIKEIYNQNQYNGEPYIGINSLSPLYSNLYSNGSLIFSRNLYNISKQNNMTMSSVEIPNNYLNDLTISQNDLISETNLQMNSDNTNWTKNIYEVVDLNFLNTISVIDEDTNTPYLQSATRINNSITDINDYEDTICNKVRINYVDNTTNVFSIVWEEIDSTHKQTEFSIYVDKPILSIDYISNDTNTIYCTKQLEVEVGNYYTINQKIKIGV